MRNVSDKSSRENQNTHLMFSDLSSENRALYEITLKNIVERGRPQMTMWRMCIACWIPKSTDTHSQYVTHCFSTAAVVARTRLIVTLYLHYLSFKIFLFLVHCGVPLVMKQIPLFRVLTVLDWTIQNLMRKPEGKQATRMT